MVRESGHKGRLPDCFQHVLNLSGSIDASPTDYSSRVFTNSLVEHKPSSRSFQGRSPGQLPSRKLTQSFMVRNIADVAGVALLVRRANGFSPLPFLASEVYFVSRCGL